MEWEAFEKQFLKQKREKDRDLYKIEKEVFSEFTARAIYKLALKGHVNLLKGVISTGKEANIFKGYTKSGEPRAYKIYRIETSDFRSMYEYIIGDERFKHVKKKQRDIVLAWCKKEYSNLKLAYEIGCRVPRPYAFLDNILVMQFIGNEYAAPLLKDVKLNKKYAEKIFWLVLDDLKKMYNKKLVHADVSEYNIMLWNDKPYLFDMGQSVLLSHPKAREFIERDMGNLMKYFKKLGVKQKEDEILGYIYGD